MRSPPRRRAFTMLMLLAAGCTLHSTATHWNGRVDKDGKPVFIRSSTNIGFNLAIAIPLLGNVTLDDMIEDTTATIAAENGDRVRTIESTNENYWYGFPPMTWFLTPVITTVSIEYQPSEAELEKAKESERRDLERRGLRRPTNEDARGGDGEAR